MTWRSFYRNTFDVGILMGSNGDVGSEWKRISSSTRFTTSNVATATRRRFSSRWSSSASTNKTTTKKRNHSLTTTIMCSTIMSNQGHREPQESWRSSACFPRISVMLLWWGRRRWSMAICSRSSWGWWWRERLRRIRERTRKLITKGRRKIKRRRVRRRRTKKNNCVTLKKSWEKNFPTVWWKFL